MKEKEELILFLENKLKKSKSKNQFARLGISNKKKKQEVYEKWFHRLKQQKQVYSYERRCIKLTKLETYKKEQNIILLQEKNLNLKNNLLNFMDTVKNEESPLLKEKEKMFDKKLQKLKKSYDSKEELGETGFKEESFYTKFEKDPIH